jgi:hypothetical protein
MEESINELFIPRFLVVKPKISDLSWISVGGVLDYKIVIDFGPILAPGGTPEGNIALSNLVEGVGLKDRKDF